MNISTILDMAAEAFGDRTAIVCGSQRLTYTELRDAAWRAAKAIADAKVNCIGLLDVNSPAAPIALFGAAYAGLPYVPLNYRLTAPEINELIDRITPCLLVTGAEFLKLPAARAGLQVLERKTFLDTVCAPGAEAAQAPEDPRAIAVQIFTSGTTGKPKAAILRHENLMSYIVGTIEFGCAAEDEAVAVTVPPYHIAGISANLSATYACRRMVQMEGFDAREWLAACEREHVTNAFLVPTMLSRILDELDACEAASNLPALRAVAYGGGKMPLSTIRRAMRRFPQVDFTNAYGLTETSATIAVLGPQDHRDAAGSNDPSVQKRLGSIGRATGAVEIQVRSDAGATLGAEEVGMIFARGGQVSGEYQSGSLLDSDGWFCTRDRGYMDRDGFLFLDGRADDVIVRGGENISPGEIEEVLLTHPAVADAAVVACPDEQWGEGVAAAVVLKPGAQVSVAELQECVKARLRSSRVPQQIVFKAELPYNELGKVLRRVIRQEFAVPGR